MNQISEPGFTKITNCKAEPRIIIQKIRETNNIFCDIVNPQHPYYAVLKMK
jgi:hypothetical protein